MSRDGIVTLPCSAIGSLRFVIVVIPDHTHLLLSPAHQIVGATVHVANLVNNNNHPSRRWQLDTWSVKTDWLLYRQTNS